MKPSEDSVPLMHAILIRLNVLGTQICQITDKRGVHRFVRARIDHGSTVKIQLWHHLTRETQFHLQARHRHLR
jgi:hypothetical protein